MALDGFVNGERPRDDKGQPIKDDDNEWMKSDWWIPGLIVFVNTEGERQADPWLTVILYNCNKPNIEKPELDKDYYIEMRDLLLTEKNHYLATILPSFTKPLTNPIRT